MTSKTPSHVLCILYSVLIRAKQVQFEVNTSRHKHYFSLTKVLEVDFVHNRPEDVCAVANLSLIFQESFEILEGINDYVIP